MLVQIIVFLSLMYQAYGRKVQVPFCSSNTSLCTLSEDYNHLIPPRLNTSKPCQINPRIGISTIEVNEESHYVKLLLELKLDWIDHNLELVDYHSDWFQIDGTNFKIWHPTLYFENLVDIKKLIGYGADHNVQFWFNRMYQRLYYTEIIEVSVSCEMNFNDFPKDKHSCDLIFGAYDFSSSAIMYTAPIVVYDSERIDQVKEVLEVQSASSKYNIKIKQIQPYETKFKIKGATKQESKTYYSFTGSQVSLTRKGIDGALASTFYVPTALFAIFSFVSFLIQPDAIPGRIGLIVTLFLISSNVYVSVDAPSERGFSYIEIWIIGSQAPIVFALFEYGCILATVKYGKPDGDFCQLDLYSFVLTMLFYVSFNVYYWITLNI